MNYLITLVLGCLLMFTGGCGRNDASMVVKNYLDSYRNFLPSVSNNLKNVSDGMNVSNELNNKYFNVYKRQYENLSYEILSEKYDGNHAIVKIKLSVYDYRECENVANEYLNNFPNEFITNNSYDLVKFVDYKLELMKNQTKRIDYDLEIELYKKNRKWIMNQLSDEKLRMINGLF